MVQSGPIVGPIASPGWHCGCDLKPRPALGVGEPNFLGFKATIWDCTWLWVIMMTHLSCDNEMVMWENALFSKQLHIPC